MPIQELFQKNWEEFKRRWIRTGKVCHYPKIAACYITKDSEEFIEYSIKSIYDMVSKIIIIDNCSKDKTLEILQKMKDPQNKVIFISREFKDKTEQRNVYCEMLDNMDYAWIIDSDEVWDSDNLRKIESLIFANPEVPSFCFNFIDFWKDFAHVSKGIWETFTGRKSLINLNLAGKIKYNIHTSPITIDDKEIPAVFCKDIKFFHYSYVRSDERIKDKIDYYIKTGTPGFKQQGDWYTNVWLKWDTDKEEVEKKGTHLFGGGTTKLFTGEHPEVMRIHPRYMEYLDKYKLKINLSVFPIQHNNFQNITFKNDNLFEINKIFCEKKPYIIFIEDVLEHISYNMVGEFMVKIYDILEIGGEIVIQTPNMIEILKKYLSNEIPYVDFVKVMYGGQTDIIDFHACIYDSEAIKALLNDVGFSDINIEYKDNDLNMLIIGKKYRELK